jgi:hypothetical protein
MPGSPFRDVSLIGMKRADLPLSAESDLPLSAESADDH